MSKPVGAGVFTQDNETNMIDSEKPPRKRGRNGARSRTMSSDDAGKKTKKKTSLPPASSVRVERMLATKWDLLPDILRARGLVKQHIKSFDYFINNTMKDIVRANRFVHSDIANSFSLEFKSVEVGHPSIKEESYSTNEDVHPMMCRIRDLTYSAPIYTQVVYVLSLSKENDLLAFRQAIKHQPQQIQGRKKAKRTKTLIGPYSNHAPK